MRKIQVTDCVKIKARIEDLFVLISDVRVYPLWWPESVEVKVLEYKEDGIGSKVEIRAEKSWFRCTIVSMDKPSSVIIRYYDGVHRGVGIWTLKQVAHDTVWISYEIDLKPNGLIPRMLSNFMDFTKMHSDQMAGMFQKMQGTLAETNSQSDSQRE